MKIKKLKNMLIAVVMTMIFAIALLTPPLGAAFADDWSGTADNPETHLDYLYYFSDDEESNATYQKIKIQQYVKNIEYNYWAADSFWQMVKSYNFDVIENAYIIFEVKNSMDIQIIELDDPIYFDLLLNIFSTLKMHGCKIMFISAVQESRYVDYTEFLDYVDIHIDLDIFTLFMDNVFRKTEEKIGDPINNCTFYLDSYFSDNVVEDYHENWFFRTYFIPYFRAVFMDEIRYGGLSQYTVLRRNSINIVCRIDETRYWDFVNRTYIEYFDLQQYFDNGPVIPIGTTLSGLQETILWLNTFNDFGISDVAYVYDPFNYNLSYSYADLREAHAPTDYYDIIADFLQDEDLTAYQNFAGRCVITHKAVTVGPGGWMDMDSGGNSGSAGYQLVMSLDDYLHYIDFDDDL